MSEVLQTPDVVSEDCGVHSALWFGPHANDTVSDPIPLKTKRTGNVPSAGGKLILHVTKNNNDVTLLADFAKYVCPVKE